MTEPQSSKADQIYSLKIPPEKKAEKKKSAGRRKKWLVILGLVLALAAALIFQRMSQDPKVEVARAEVVQEGLPQTTLTAGGYVVADSTILVSSQINGKVEAVLVEEGDAVHQGQILAEIEDDDYRAKYELAKADYNLATQTLNRKRVLFRQGVIAKAEYDEAVARYGVQKASYESAKYFLENTKVKSPIDGTVIQKEKEPGEFLLPGITSEGVPGSAVIKVADLRVMNVEMDILESDLEKVKMDQPAVVFPDALPGRSYNAKLFYIAPQANRQKSIVQIKVRIEKPDEKLKPEMSARVYFLEKPVSQTIMRRVTIPETALVKQGSQNLVYTVRKDVLVENKVEVASVKEGKAYLASGLNGDEPVVLLPRSNFKSGMKVQVKSLEAEK